MRLTLPAVLVTLTFDVIAAPNNKIYAYSNDLPEYYPDVYYIHLWEFQLNLFSFRIVRCAPYNFHPEEVPV